MITLGTVKGRKVEYTGMHSQPIFLQSMKNCICGGEAVLNEDNLSYMVCCRKCAKRTNWCGYRFRAILKWNDLQYELSEHYKIYNEI